MGKASAKKKGPKGKKARLAAKLDRHWGEYADEDEMQKARIRKGKSRILPGSRGIKKNKSISEKQETEFNDNVLDISESEHESDFSLEDETAGNIVEGSLNSLLKQIKGTSKPSIKNTIDSENENSSDDDDSMTSNSVEFKLSEQDDESHTMEKIDFDFEGMKATGPSPYEIHFSKDPLKLENKDLPSSKENKRVKMDNLDENIVLHVPPEVKKKYEMSSKEESCAMDSFRHVHKTISKNWATVNAKAFHKDADASNKKKSQPVFSEMQAAIYPMISNYCDAQITCTNRDNRGAIENVLVLHVLNHILTANHDITSHNNRIREIEKRDEVVDGDQFRDQGYTRPKVLVFLPTRSAAFNFTNDMLKMLGDGYSVENQEKFKEEFGPLNFEKDANTESEKRRRAVQKAKGKDWLELFGDTANSDDDFKIGISMSNMKSKAKKQKRGGAGVAVKLFSDFYYSDIILASPIGLKMTTNEHDEDEDFDFLSSIEIVIALQSDVLLMQNWDHMSVLERLNQQPKKSAGIDFSRVRNYLLSGQASYWRQTLMVSRFIDPNIISTFNRYSNSIAGKLKVRRKIPNESASICHVLTRVRQVFQRISCDSFLTQGESRLKYFKDAILPQMIRTKQKNTLIYIPSYFDFISLRNILLKNEIASHHFVSVTEYARVSEVSRGRAQFLQGKKRIMLYTGRAHFFMRHHIKGAKHLILLGLPENAEFYPELLNMLSEQSSKSEDDLENIDSTVSCINLFTKYDVQCLERIVGTKHSERMVKSQKKTFLFTS